MGKYANAPMERLATQLKAGLLRLRKGYVDRAETLLAAVDPAQEYPCDFIVYRITGYRPPSAGAPSESIGGKSLRADLLRLILDLCSSFELNISEYDEPVYDTPMLAKEFNVSSKTIQRWRRRGLPARRMIFADGKPRVAFLKSVVDRFVSENNRQVMRSMKFSQMTRAEREDIIRRAKRMAAFTRCCLSDVAKRLAVRTGRAVETIRYTIRKHDLSHPESPVFPSFSGQLGEEEKTQIYHSFLGGESVPELAQRYHRTRGSIYRIVNEMRASQLIKRKIGYVYSPQFDLPNADETILPPGLALMGGEESAPEHAASPDDLPPYLKALYDVPLLSAKQESDLFRLFNYLKHKADKLRQRVNPNRVVTSQLKQIEALLLQANTVKNRIIRANLRLVVSIAKKHLSGPQSLFELISDGNVSLIKAIEKFDYTRGFRFSTYASWAIMRNFARSVPREKYQLDRFSTGQDEVLDIAAGLKTYDPNESNLPELRESIDVMLMQLSPRERAILVDHYGLDDSGESKTFDQLGRQMGLSKERVRQIELQAMKKLRRVAQPGGFGIAP